MLWDSSRFLKNLEDVLGFFEESLRILEDCLGFLGMFWDALRFFEILQDS